jgi:hypothetical protein
MNQQRMIEQREEFLKHKQQMIEQREEFLKHKGTHWISEEENIKQATADIEWFQPYLDAEISAKSIIYAQAGDRVIAELKAKHKAEIEKLSNLPAPASREEIAKIIAHGAGIKLSWDDINYGVKLGYLKQADSILALIQPVEYEEVAVPQNAMMLNSFHLKNNGRTLYRQVPNVKFKEEGK